MNFKVSIILPTYNCEGTITRAINSVLLQTYQNWELLICDDCSSDDTCLIVAKIAASDKRIKLIVGEENVGVALNRNRGLASVSGEVVAFLDSDDYWFDYKLEVQLDVLKKTNSRIVFGDYYENKNGLYRLVKSKNTVSSRDFEYCNPIGNLTGIVKLDGFSIRQENVGHEDYLMWSKLVLGGLGVNVGKPCAVYCISTSSVSSNKLKALCWYKKIWSEYFGVSGLRLGARFLGFFLIQLRKRRLAGAFRENQEIKDFEAGLSRMTRVRA